MVTLADDDQHGKENEMPSEFLDLPGEIRDLPTSKDWSPRLARLMMDKAWWEDPFNRPLHDHVIRLKAQASKIIEEQDPTWRWQDGCFATYERQLVVRRRQEAEEDESPFAPGAPR
jgi:hypothetical protein